MSFSPSKNPPGLILDNLDEVKPAHLRTFGIGVPSDRGFSKFPKRVKPVFRHLKRKGRKPLDLESMGGFWLITERTRDVFDAVDASAFDYLPCEVVYEDEPTQSAFVCDVVRILDALDEEHSDIVVKSGIRKQYIFRGSLNLAFNEQVVGASHIFRMEYSYGQVICDEKIRDACKDAKLKSLYFYPAYK